jgi:hypothetical protein
VAFRDDTAFCAAAGLSKSTKPYPEGGKQEEREARSERHRERERERGTIRYKYNKNKICR